MASTKSEPVASTAPWIILIITGLASFLTPFLGASVNVALPAINNEFNPDTAMMGWIVTIYLLTAAICIVPFGRISDMYGRRPVFIGGLLVLSAGTLLAGLSTDVIMLIAFRIIQGVGSAMIFGTSVAILASYFPPQKRGQAIGINIACVYLGLSLGPFLGGIITQNLGWRALFLIIAPMCLIASILGAITIKDEARDKQKGKFDVPGSVLYSLMLMALIYGLSLLPEFNGVYLLAAAAVLIAVFIWWELRQKSPVLNIRVFKSNITFTFSNLAALVNYSATFAVGYLLSLYLQYNRGFDPQTAGIILVAQPIVQAALSPFTGKLSDRMDPKIVASIGMVICVVGLLLLSMLGESTSLYYIVGTLMLMGLGFALFSSPNTNAIMSSVERKDYGVASGMVSTMRLIGQMMSIGIAMMVFSLIMGEVDISPEVYPGLLSSIKIAFGIFAVLCAAGVIASLMRGKLNRS